MELGIEGLKLVGWEGYVLRALIVQEGQVKVKKALHDLGMALLEFEDVGFCNELGLFIGKLLKGLKGLYYFAGLLHAFIFYLGNLLLSHLSPLLCRGEFPLNFLKHLLKALGLHPNFDQDDLGLLHGFPLAAPMLCWTSATFDLIALLDFIW